MLRGEWISHARHPNIPIGRSGAVPEMRRNKGDPISPKKDLRNAESVILHCGGLSRWGASGLETRKIQA